MIRPATSRRFQAVAVSQRRSIRNAVGLLPVGRVRLVGNHGLTTVPAAHPLTRTRFLTGTSTRLPLSWNCWYSTSPSNHDNDNDDDASELLATVPVVKAKEFLSDEAAMKRMVESFDVLDQLIQDDSPSIDGVFHHPQPTHPLVTTSILAIAVVAWQTWWTRPSSVHSCHAEDWTTDQVRSKVQFYQTKLPSWLQPGSADWLRIYNALLTGYLADCQRHRNNAASIAHQATQLVETQMLGQNPPLHPNAKSYELLLEIHVVARDLPGAIHVLDGLVQQQQQQGASGNARKNQPSHEFRIDYSLFEKLLTLCVDLRSRDRGWMADQVMNRMIQLSQGGFLSSRPQTGHYTRVMDAWAKSEHPAAGQRTLEIWNFLRHASLVEAQWWLQPDSTALLSVLHAHARLGQAETAEQILWETCHSDQRFLQGELANYNAVLDAWGKAQTYQSGERAERLLRVMMTVGGSILQPDVISFNSTMHAWAASGHPDAGMRAERLLDELRALAQTNPELEPNSSCYTTLISAWARVGNVDQAASVLATMCTRYQAGESVSMPKTEAFSAALNAYAQARNPHGAEQLLRHMQQSGIPQVQPTTTSYNTVIKAWAQSKCPSAGREAERLLREMQAKGDATMAPDSITFNSVMSAHARSWGGESAERILRELQGRGGQDVISYNVAINAWAKQGNPQRAEILIEEMKKEGRFEPNQISLMCCIEAWSRSRLAEGGDKADHYLKLLAAFKVDWKSRVGQHKMAKMCWTNSARANHPRAAQRIEELNQILLELQEHQTR